MNHRWQLWLTVLLATVSLAVGGGCRDRGVAQGRRQSAEVVEAKADSNEPATPESDDERENGDPPATPEPRTEAPAVNEAASQSQPPANGDDAVLQESPTADAGDDVSPPVSPPVEDSAETTREPAPAERILLLTRGGPLLVDLHITIGGEPFQNAQQELIDEVLKLADSDEDGVTTWDEITSHPRFRYGQFGNPPSPTYRDQQNLIRAYDSMMNGRVDREELPRYLTSNMGTSKSLNLQTSNYHREFNRIDSPVRKWLDRDGDRVLSAEEIEQAPGRLRTRDADNDEILLAADFRDVPASANSMRQTPRVRSYGPNAVRHLGPRTDWNQIQYELRELYARTGELADEDFPLTPTLYAQLDSDEDDYLAGEELESLLELPPHIALDVEFEPEEHGPRPQPRIAMRSLNLGFNSVFQLVQRTDSRMTVSLPDVVIDLFVSDQIGFGDFESQAASLLARGDANQDQYLDGDEFAAVAQNFNVPLEAVDTDGNEMLYVDEIRQFLQQRQAAVRSQIRVTADDQEDALFTAIDGNNDGRLDGREISHMSSTLLQMDGNDDGQVQLHEITGSMVIGVARGNSQDARLFEIPVALVPPGPDVPRWFRSMDRNSDGGISRREFLGTRQQFDNLDRNQDAFIDSQEAQRE